MLNKKTSPYEQIERRDHEYDTIKTVGFCLLLIGVAIIVSVLIAGCSGYMGEKGVRAQFGHDANVIADKMDAAEEAGEVSPAIGQDSGGPGSALGWLGAGAAAIAGVWFGRGRIKSWVTSAIAMFDSLPFRSWSGRAVPEEEIASTPQRVNRLEERVQMLEGSVMRPEALTFLPVKVLPATENKAPSA